MIRLEQQFSPSQLTQTHQRREKISLSWRHSPSVSLFKVESHKRIVTYCEKSNYIKVLLSTVPLITVCVAGIGG